MAVSGYIYDLDKAYDFMNISKEEFLNSYSYLTEEDYEAMYSLSRGILFMTTQKVIFEYNNIRR